MFERHCKPTCRLALTVTLIVAVTATLARASRSVLLSRPIDDVLLEQHNIFRQEEKASNIFKMHWNKTVAQAAGEWASQCQFKHKMTGEYGENLFYSSDPSFEDFDIREILLGGMEVWHDEKRGWRYSSDACGSACHYTQMVWASTTSVGCAHQMCHGLKVGRRSVDRALYLVCFYYPRGNWVGEYPFKTGRPCSDCGSGSCQDGLCVEEKASFSAYHTQSDNEVKSGSSWNWQYQARGRDSLHQASSVRNVSRVTSRDPAHNGYRHTSARHTQHDVRISSPRGHQSHHSSSSVYRVSHSTDDQQEMELRERQMRYSSSGGSRRELESYGPSRSRLPPLPPASLRQSPRQAQYARSALERVNNNNGNGKRRGSSRGEGRIELQRDAHVQRSKSPLDVIREGTHWCRDRLPSCRIWTRECRLSKAVYLACPRTCGHCGRKKDQEKTTTHTLQDRPPTPSQPSPNSSSRSRSRQQQQQQQQQQTHPRAPQQFRQPPPPSPSPRSRHRSSQQRQTLRSTVLPQHRRLQRHRKQQQQQQRLRNLPHRKTKGSQRGRKKGGKRRQGQGQGQRRRKERQGNKGRRGPLAGAGRKRKNRRQRHRKFQTVDKRAEELAAELRQKTLMRGGCADDPKYTRSCPMWVQKGFCNGNVLVSDIYCKLSCGSC